MVRPERVSWKDTNLALIGSDLDLKIKAAAAANEPQWVHVGESVGLYVWRIEKFIVKPWPKSKYGKFHTGDSYVVLNTYQPNLAHRSKLAFDIHIWIGTESSQDEYGTAAYKMVELDDRLGGTPTQHREVQGRESQLFLSYFGHKITYLAGGVETGFRHVEAGQGSGGIVHTESATEAHLFHIKGKGTTLRMTQESQVRRDALNEGDVFILTANDRVWLWVGKLANHDEKTKGMEVAREMCNNHHHGAVETVQSSEPEADHAEFYKLVPATTSGTVFKKRVQVQEPDDEDEDSSQAFPPVIYQCIPSGSGGAAGRSNHVSFRKVAMAQCTKVGVTTAWRFDSSSLSLSMLQSKYTESVLILDTGFHCFVWIGASGNVSTSPVTLERAYAKQFHRPDELPLTILKQNQETTKFKEYFAEGAKAATTKTPATRKDQSKPNQPQHEAVEGKCSCLIL